MEIKIEIKTPAGEAEKTEKRIKPFLLGKAKLKESYINSDASKLIWVIEAPVRKVLSIQRNVNRFETVIAGILQSKSVKRTIVKHLNTKDQHALKKMLTDQTEVRIIKQATAQELVESNKTFWQKIKETFNKREN